MLSDRITTIFELLGCNNSDIARLVDCSPSNISRIHSGSRSYKPQDKPIMRLAEGIYTFADSNNLLVYLCKLCRSDDDSREILIPALIAWMFDTDEASLPEITVPAERRRKTDRAQNCRDFGERLNDLMELLDMSNMRLARQINVDASHISRFRNGVRSPRPNTLISNLLTQTLLNRAKEQNRLASLSKLTSIPQELLSDNEEGNSAFSTWLYAQNSLTDTTDVDRLLECIDSFSPETKIQLPAILPFAIENITDNDSTVYWGINGLRTAVLRFLGNTAKCGGEIWLYSDEDIGWMIEDRAYFAKWYTLMLSCIKKGVRIRIIHNLNRKTEETISAIKSWMPLYMSGMIDPYICRKGHDTIFTHTIFLRPNGECIYASHIKGTEPNGWYEYLTDKQKIKTVTDEYAKLFEQTEPLVKIYVGNNDIMYKEKPKGCSSSLLSSLSLGTMPEELLSTILKRNNVNCDEAKRIKAFYIVQRQRIKEALDDGRVHEFLSLPTDDELFSGKVRINLSPSLIMTNIFYTPDEYAAHIQAIISLLKESTSYHLYSLPELPFNDIQIIMDDDRVTVIRSKQPYAAFVFTEPMMYQAFYSYFNLLKEHQKCDRSEVKRSLARFL